MRDVELIDTPERCRSACNELRGERLLALDIEGVDICRTGEICILQIAKRVGTVYLFDVTVLGELAFANGLREILESEDIAKLLFDCRADGDALYHLFGVKPTNILDMQVLRVRSVFGTSQYLDGYAKVLKDVLPSDALQEAERVKAAGVQLFSPQIGGRYEVWRERPLEPALLMYCAQDVSCLFIMLDVLGKWLNVEDLRAISEKRMHRWINTPFFVKGPHMALVDFDFRDPGRGGGTEYDHFHPRVAPCTGVWSH